MADIGISYAHVDAALAIGIRRAFVERGFSVWMDEAGESSEDAESIGLPWGQAHWDVITAEFAAANVIVVVDTPAWRQSRYCQNEYAYVRDWGKWVEFIDSHGDAGLDDRRVSEIAALLATRQSVTSAHTRLVEAARTEVPRNTSRLERLLHHAEERDARLVLASTSAVDGVTVTDRIGPYAQAAIERSRLARKRLRRSAISVTAVLAVLALVGVGALMFARAGERSAQQSAARSQSLELAGQSATEVDTNKALAQAREAERLSPSRESTEAVNVATANEARLRTLVIGPEDFMAATWAADAPVIVAYLGKRLVVLDAETGAQLRSINVDDRIRLGSVAMSKDATLAAFVTQDGQRLRVADLNTGDVHALDIHNVNVVTTGDGDELWWSADDGLYRAPFATLGTAAPQHYPLDVPALAIDITADRHLLDYIDARGLLHNASYDATSITESGVVPIVPTDAGPDTPSPTRVPISNAAAVVDPSVPFGASLRRCGNNIFGGIAGHSALKGTSFNIIDGTLTTKWQAGSPRTPVCNADGSAWYTTVMPGGPSQNFGTGVPSLPRGAERTLPVTDPSNSRVSAITNNGRLYHIPAVRIRGYDADGALTMLTIGSTEYLIHADRITHAESGAETGRVLGPVDPSSAAAVDGYGAIATRGMLWRIDASGHAGQLMRLNDLTIHHIRGGADGKTFVCTTPDSVLLIDAATGDTSSIDIEGLAADETPIDADISTAGDAVSFITDAGRVGTITIAGSEAVAAPQFASEALAPGPRSRMAYLPGTSNLIATTSDGAVRVLDEDLRLGPITFFGGVVDKLSTTGAFAVLTSEAQGTTVYDSQTLTVRDRLAPETSHLSSDSVALDLGGKRLTGLVVPNPRTGADSTRRHIPLPTV
ncbi:toll/interleukin-1 receptor domain-containing protein [Mycobacterium sp. NPDC051198]